MSKARNRFHDLIGAFRRKADFINEKTREDIDFACISDDMLFHFSDARTDRCGFRKGEKYFSE